jgi:hypothetical protein
MKEEKILTLHPQGKSGRNIKLQTYEMIKQTLLGILKKGELTHTELFVKVKEALEGKMEGNIGWYAETVKLDLEARDLIERTSSKPQKYRLKHVRAMED